jgi:type III restriction enzyme
MKFTLKDYQEEAVKDVLLRLGKASKRWHEDGDMHAFSLTAATGAGKTVIAASVFESLFFGNDDYEIVADPGAVVIWFSDDPSLNEQSRWRLQEASDRLTVSDLVTVGNSFNADKFRPGKVYFLNTQKLSKNSLLVRGHDPEDSDVEQMSLMPDMRQHTIWDVIRNTIEDPDLTLYLVLDEAHRGMKEGARSNGDNKPTIVKQLINGTGSVPGVPVVWGISATVQRFDEAISGMQLRSTLPNVVVDSSKVQASGLLKDAIILDIPSESGDFATVLLRRAASKLREVSNAWEEYSKQQVDAEKVIPLMVLQVPNSPDHRTVAVWLDTIFDAWPDLPRGGVANVFGEHKTETFGSYDVGYIAPERVQESTWVRILIAKDAISTGWDCPRAEVMVSLRRATDKTHITQLLGRMVRTPLARRIPGDERLNSVDCLLPLFDKVAVQAVVSELMTGESGEQITGRRVLVNPSEMKINPEIPEKVWDNFSSLPSQALPKRQTRQIKRLTALAHELAADSLLEDAGKIAHAKMHKVLDEYRKQHSKEIKEARKSVLTVDGVTGKADLESQELTFNDFVETADFAVIEGAYRAAARLLSPDLATSYSEHIADKVSAHEKSQEETLLEAHTEVAAMGLLIGVKSELDKAAVELTSEWLSKFRVQIKKLSDERQEVYREIREMSADPLDIDLAKPITWIQPTTVRRQDGKEEPLPLYPKHLLCDEKHLFPCELNHWEEKILKTELDREGTVSWYRNPAHARQDSLGIKYEEGSETKVVRPDFIFFSKTSDGSIVADIVDPHGIQFSDALPKMKGLAIYVKNNPNVYRRVEVCAEVNGGFRSIDLTQSVAQDAVMAATSILDLYRGEFAKEYV